MSYARFVESDVYMYYGSPGVICANCGISDTDPIFDNDFGAAIRHLHEHERAGDRVPKRAYRQLIEDLVGDDDMVPRREHE
jgi:hypothetical protein